MRVLIVDPSGGLRRSLEEVFDELGWEVLHSSDPDEALALCRAHRPDVALLDAALAPAGSPSSLLGQLKADPALQTTRVVALEDELDLHSALAGLEAGIDEYLTAPVSGAEAAVRVRTAVRVGELEEQLAQRSADLESLIHTDAHTGVFNRRFVAHQLVAQINSARRHGRALAVLVIDVDAFKQLNDTHGHTAGDQALKLIAKTLHDRLREEDFLGRWGGDEFVVLLPDGRPEAALHVAEALRQAVEELRVAHSWVLTVSVGVAAWNDEDAVGLFTRADGALYAAKRTGRNRVAVAPDLRSLTPSPPPPAGGAGDPAGHRMLIVDDVPEIRRAVGRYLELNGMVVLGEASDGRKALEAVEQLRPDVVVMDMHMPGMDGIQAARELTARHPEVVIVGFTSTEEPRIAQAMREAGIVAHFHKGQLDALIAYLTGAELEQLIRRRRSASR